MLVRIVQIPKGCVLAKGMASCKTETGVPPTITRGTGGKTGGTGAAPAGQSADAPMFAASPISDLRNYYQAPVLFSIAKGEGKEKLIRF
jgi:hypothetical protein